MISAGNSYVGSMVRADARRGYPSRYVRLVLGEESRWRDGRMVEGEQSTFHLTAATARTLAKALVAEARIIEAGRKR